LGPFYNLLFLGGSGGTDTPGSDYSPLDAGGSLGDEGVGQGVLGVVVCAGIFLGLLVVLLLCLGKGRTKNIEFVHLLLYFKRVKNWLGSFFV
jgi:hypothetical protein